MPASTVPRDIPDAKVLQNGTQVRKEEDVHAASAGNACSNPVASLGSKISLLQALEQPTIAVENISSGLDPFHGIHDQ